RLFQRISVRNTLQSKACRSHRRFGGGTFQPKNAACLTTAGSTQPRTRIAGLLMVLAVSAALATERVPASPDIRDHAWAVLNEGLGHSHASPRLIAVQALSLMQNNRTAERSAMRALNDRDAKVRAAAATTLGQLNASRAIPALRKALEDDQVSVVLASA